MALFVIQEVTISIDKLIHSAAIHNNNSTFRLINTGSYKDGNIYKITSNYSHVHFLIYSTEQQNYLK